MKNRKMYAICLVCCLPSLLAGQDSPGEAPTSYRLLPKEQFVAGEALIISIAADQESILNGGFPINSFGYVDFPIAGKLMVTDKTPHELERYLAQQMANYTRDVNISAEPAIRIAFFGDFKEPGLHYVNPDQVVWDAFVHSQGPKLEEKIMDMYILRGTRKLLVHPLDIFSSGKTLREAGIQSGDIFALPEPPRREAWDYFRDIVQLTMSLATVTASIITTVILVDTRL